LKIRGDGSGVILVSGRPKMCFCDPAQSKWRSHMRDASRRLSSLLFISLLISSPVRADDLADAALSVCEKMKACAIAQIPEENLTPEVRQVMQPMLDDMCVKMQSALKNAPSGHPLYAPALACMRSMEASSCERIQDLQREKTSECEAYEKVQRETYDGE
jgi:hypothetical protein